MHPSMSLPSPLLRVPQGTSVGVPTPWDPFRGAGDGKGWAGSLLESVTGTNAGSIFETTIGQQP